MLPAAIVMTPAPASAAPPQRKLEGDSESLRGATAMGAGTGAMGGVARFADGTGAVLAEAVGTGLGLQVDASWRSIVRSSPSATVAVTVAQTRSPIFATTVCAPG